MGRDNSQTVESRSEDARGRGNGPKVPLADLVDRVDIAARSTHRISDQLREFDDEQLPEGIADEIGTISERLRRARSALADADRDTDRDVEDRDEPEGSILSEIADEMEGSQ